jgi:hypothetical protein
MNKSLAPNTTRLQSLGCSVSGASLPANQIILAVSGVVISLITILRGTG